MEFFKTKLFGGEVNVLFTGPNYFFFHGFYGVICIAERDEEVELSNPLDEQVWKSKFVLYSGHRDGNIELDRHFCGIKGCKCGGIARAKIEF